MDRMPLGKLHRWLACGRFHDSTRASLRDQRPQTNLPLFFGIALIGSSTKRDQTKTKTTHVWLPMTIPRCHWFFPKKLCSLAGATASHTDASSISHHSKKNSTRRTVTAPDTVRSSSYPTSPRSIGPWSPTVDQISPLIAAVPFPGIADSKGHALGLCKVHHDGVRRHLTEERS